MEMLMAMLIMAVGLLGLLQSVNVAYEHNTRNRLRNEAVLVGEEEMNRFRSRGYDAITAANAVSTVARGGAGGTKYFMVTKQYNSAGGDSKKLKVAIGWSFKRVSTVHVIYSLKSR